MTDEEMKRLSRQELLELLLEEMKKNQQLQDKLDEANKQLEDRKIQIENAGSLAEAVVSINHLFEDADQAVAQYIENVNAYASRVEARCKKMVRETEKKCREMENEAGKQ